jgi:hypothetical protein
MTWKASGTTELPLADREREWDGDAARKRIFKWAGWDDAPKTSKARRAFFAYDNDDTSEKGSYKLPYADIIGGELKAVPRAIFAVAQVLEGARGGVDLPDSVISATRKRVEKYYKKMGEEAPW